MYYLTQIAALFLILSSLGLADEGTNPNDASACIRCHQDVEGHAVLHAPVISGECSACHDAQPLHLASPTRQNVATENPNLETCAKCHPTPHLKANVHVPVNNEKSCLNCHDPHGGSARFLLRQSPTGQCLSCHENNLPKNAASEHSFLRTENNSCTQCHDPHSGDTPKLVRQRTNDLCLSCHNRRIDFVTNRGGLSEPATYAVDDIAQKISEPNHIHSALKKGDCAQCHNPHAASNPYLLNKGYPEGSYAKYEGTKTYALCLDCHTQVLNKDLKGPTKNMTKFRNDRKLFWGLVTERQNLHWFHVVNAAGSDDKSRGRSCSICHDAHGNETAQGVAETWHMSRDPESLGYSIRIKYEPSKSGGSCTICHTERKRYERLEDERQGR